MVVSLARRTATVLAVAALAAPLGAQAATANHTDRDQAVTPPAVTTRDRVSARYTSPTGTSSTYHLHTSKVTNSAPVGLVVYLDGDGMYGHRNPGSTWALGGRDGIVAQAGTRGYATLSILTPSRDRTFWTNGRVNAAYVASLTDHIRSELGVQRTWLVGYSGGSQLITKFLLPAHSATFTAGGGAVITGGGGAPTGTPAIHAALKTSFPMLWHTGTADTGPGSSDGYNALADARRGHNWYTSRGLATRLETPAGVDHDDLGGRFGTILANQLDRHTP